jgi:hypothetical protein
MGDCRNVDFLEAGGALEACHLHRGFDVAAIRGTGTTLIREQGTDYSITTVGEAIQG